MRPWWTILDTSLNIDDAVIIALADRCPALTQINVSWCTNLTDAAIIALAEHCPTLTVIDVSYCRNLTDAAIIALAEHCPALTEVNAMYCNKMTDAVLSFPFNISFQHFLSKNGYLGQLSQQ